jgi:hypothetical protein
MTHNPPFFQPTQEGGDGGLGEPPLGMQGLPDGGGTGLASLPEEPEDGDLEFGELVLRGHTGLRVNLQV